MDKIKIQEYFDIFLKDYSEVDVNRSTFTSNVIKAQICSLQHYQLGSS